jgi:hypothetical protein
MRTLTLICAVLLIASCGKPPDNPAPGPSPAARFPFGGGGVDSSPIIISDGSIKVSHSEAGSYFSVLGPGSAFLKLANHEPNTLGFGCNPSPTATTNACPTTTPVCGANTGSFVNTIPCTLPVDPANVDTPTSTTTWTLSLCDSSTATYATCGGSSTPVPVTLIWPSPSTPGDFERIDATTTPPGTTTSSGNFTLDVDPSVKGPALKYVNPGASSTTKFTLVSARLSQAVTTTSTSTNGNITTITTTTANTVYDFNLTTSSSAITRLMMTYLCNPSGNNTCKP